MYAGLYAIYGHTAVRSVVNIIILIGIPMTNQNKYGRTIFDFLKDQYVFYNNAIASL
jgi:hypothetical protein